MKLYTKQENRPHSTPRTAVEGTSQFKDRRPLTNRLQQLNSLTESSPHSSHLTALQAKADNGAGKSMMQRYDLLQTVQRQVMDDEETLQGKFAVIQRINDEEEEPLQGKFTALQRQEDDDEILQGRFGTAQRKQDEEDDAAQMKTASSLQQESAALTQRAVQPNKTGLPDNLKGGIEALSGISMDNVKVHYNSSQPAQLDALAYAQGTDIHVAPGQEQHMPHEAWHVVQQAQGRVKPTMQMKAGVPVNDDTSLEREADIMGAKALQMFTPQQPHT